ncbi:MAG TPA: acyltransferase [Bacteroidia bacterium]|nr:acyltransferase [Bacteroidia bacterium]
MSRLHNLDYLRGLAAFGIMIYHYLSWTLGYFSADTLMGRLGIYGVSIFYVLSGLTLYYVYYDKMKPSRTDVIAFFKKRIFRIFPLLWLVTLAAILISAKMPDPYNLFLNLTGLFGFVKWDTYFSAGIWSIGNELVFYVFFPFFVLFAKSLKPLLILLSVVLLGLYIYFAFFRLNPDGNLHDQWRNYVNPLNQVFLFLGGFLIGLLLHRAPIKNWIALTGLLLAVVVFLFWPAAGDTISLVTGINRLVFTASCFLICICFYKLTFAFPDFIHKPLTLLGEASYSVYLLHPIVYGLTGLASTYIFHVPESVRLVASVTGTLIISYFVYQYFEKYFMKLGRTNKKTTS